MMDSINIEVSVYNGKLTALGNYVAEGEGFNAYGATKKEATNKLIEKIFKFKGENL